ncbi:glycine betaine ABC transporter substrate-binding protein [Halanaerobium saccharolyticum]|uniref:glycine betaine ABC transporter substrate-binding protein n=1 Tax=Halanaerobium saccharolyticum TaxID=43595 RepID=UPI003FCD3359
MERIRTIFASLIIITLLIAGMALLPEETQAQDRTVKLGYVNWAGTVAETQVAKVVLEDMMDYNVETTMVGVGPIYAALAEGDIDAFMGVWLPLTHKNYVERYQEEIIKTGPNYKGAKIGLVVPEYVDIDSVEELNDYRDKFDGKITGIEPGAGVMKATREAIKEYDLDFELLTSSGPAMVGSLERAIQKEEWIVVTGWRPHYKFAKFDLKFLEDPNNVYGSKENVYTFHHPQLAQKHPEVVSFFHDFRMTTDEVGQVMAWIEDGMEKEAAAKKWVEENKEKAKGWTNPVVVSE